MYAILINSDKSLRYAQVPDPVLTDDRSVLIRIKAAACNRADLLQRDGNYPPPPGWPEWMGLEVAGIVEETGKAVTHWTKGDAVCALLGGGGYAEKVVCDESLLMPVPEGLSMEEAACLPEAFATSYLDLVDQGGLTAGKTAFIYAGASGLGMAAIQLAKQIGAKVVTTVGSEEKAEFVHSLGADVVINHKKEDIAAVLEKNPADVAMDCVSGPALGKLLSTMNPGGKWIIIAQMGGALSEVDLRVMMKKNLSLIGITLRSRPLAKKAAILAALVREVWPAVEKGTVRPKIYRSFPLARAEEAQACMKRQENIGKIVLTVD